MDANELNALASNLNDKDEKVSFITLLEELENLNKTIELGNVLIDVFVGGVNELKEERDKIAKTLSSYFEDK
uniref:Uncharacterized protein n=1 Tax=Siphoviridae sp. ctWWc42 TaxID=2826361 RepID=A0A8S5R273_9CAUD|nr:MAG TPA: hypothetical protein [Siphoviridae sp. ctWWc42]